MNENFSPIEELFNLCERKLEGRLSEEELRRLEDLVRADANCRRAYVEYMHQHASLHWIAGAQAECSINDLEKIADGKSVPFPRAASRWQELVRNPWTIPALAASIIFAAMLTVLVAGRTGPRAALGAAPFATLSETKNVQWGPGQLPTELGSRLSPGRLRLNAGFATIQFDNGVRIVLESPADIELISPMNCVLHEGVVIANVSPEAKGFSIRTPTAHLIDYGTEFGVSANLKGETHVQVFDGIVDVQQIGSGETKRLTKGKNFRVTSTQAAMGEVQSFEAQRLDVAGPAVENSAGAITLTTAFGRGKDAYVQTEPRDEHGSDVLLLVKNAGSESFRRKAYLAFDLGGVPARQIESARLILTMAPSGYGYASFTPECSFSVYGLTSEDLDHWSEQTIAWDNAPANVRSSNPSSGYALDLAKATRLGSFKVPEGVTSGEFTLSDSALVDFLRQDQNGIVTLIVVRDTGEPRSGSLVHGFISRRNPTGAPPTLRIALQASARDN